MRIFAYGGKDQSSQVATGEAHSVREFLDEAAPYKTEDEVAEFLRGRGIETDRGAPANPAERELYIQVKSALDQA